MRYFRLSEKAQSILVFQSRWKSRSFLCVNAPFILCVLQKCIYTKVCDNSLVLRIQYIIHCRLPSAGMLRELLCGPNSDRYYLLIEWSDNKHLHLLGFFSSPLTHWMNLEFNLALEPSSLMCCRNAIYPRVQTWSRLPGTVWRGLIFFTTDRPHYHRMPPLSGDNHGWVVSAVWTGCVLGHRATTICACAHLMKTAARYQLRAQGRSFVPGPNKLGSPGEVPASVHTMGLPGKVPASGQNVGLLVILWHFCLPELGTLGHVHKK